VSPPTRLYQTDTHFRLSIPVDTKAEFGVEWVLCHRVDVQAELHRLATRPDGPGEPCKILLNSRVVSCDPEAGSVTLKDGTTMTADAIIGADGIRSAVRSAVNPVFSSSPSSHSAYRFLVPMEKIKAHPDLVELGVCDSLTMIDGIDRRIIAYPCRNKTLLNFVVCLRESRASALGRELTALQPTAN
jgi:salicylate hydroxylase